MTQDTHNQTINQQNLDRLQVQWVLGKNRGNPQPLKTEDLRMLVENGQINENQLSEEEKTALSTSTTHLEGSASEAVSPDPDQGVTDEEKVKVAYKIVQGLLQRIDQHWHNYYEEEEWRQLCENEESRAREDLFSKIYGVSSEEFGYQLFTKLVAKN